MGNVQEASPFTSPFPPILPSLLWGVVVAQNPPVCYGAEEGVRAVPDPLLPSAVCMVISSSLRDKPTAQQSRDSEAEQCPIIPALGARGHSLTRGLHVPGQMAPQTPLAGPVTLLGEFDTCQQFWLSAFVSYQQHSCLKYWEELRVRPGQCCPLRAPCWGSAGGYKGTWTFMCGVRFCSLGLPTCIPHLVW